MAGLFPVSFHWIVVCNGPPRSAWSAQETSTCDQARRNSALPVFADCRVHPKEARRTARLAEPPEYDATAEYSSLQNPT